MANYKTRGAKHLIESHIAPGTASSLTFTLLPVIDFNDVAYLQLEMDVTPSAQLKLQIQYNGDASANYYMAGKYITAGAETLLTESGQTAGTITGTHTFSAADNSAFVLTQIGLINATNAFVYAVSHIVAQNGSTLEETMTELAIDKTSLTEIKIITSTSTWKANSRFSLYRIMR